MGRTCRTGKTSKPSFTKNVASKKCTDWTRSQTININKFGSAKLYDLLVGELTDGKTDRRLSDLFKLPWRRIYTTNYDNAIENARKSTRGAHSYTLDTQARTVPDGAVVHLNGFIESVTPQSIGAGLRLTDLSYATSSFEKNREWSQFFRNDLRVSRAILFVGYSLADLDIARILIAESALKEKTAFFVAPDSDEVEVASLEPYGTVHLGGIDELFQRVDEGRKAYEKPVVKEIFYSLSDLGEDGATGQQQLKTTNAIKIHEQLVYGAVHLHEVMSGEHVFAAGHLPFQENASRMKQRE